MPRLRPDLNAHFVRYAVEPAPEYHGRTMPDGSTQWGGFPIEVRYPVDGLAEAQGVWFLCPKCFKANGGAKGTHSCEVTFAGRGVADAHGTHNDKGVPVRWAVGGSNLDDLSTTPSILLIGGCEWHGYITNGSAD